MKRILLGQLGMYGDCLYATAIARQIKQDNPGCYLIWGIGSHYASILKNNPFVDQVWEYPITSRWEVTSKWYAFAKEAQERKDRGEFDEIYLTQAYPGNPHLFYDSLRKAMFRAYGKMTVDLQPIIVLGLEEVINVTDFAKLHNIQRRENVILFEYAAESGQSYVTPEFALKVAELVVKNIPGSCVVLSGSKKIKTDNPNIIDASGLTFRENAELTEYCTLFVGAGSGITQIVQSSWAKPIPLILLLKKRNNAGVSTIWERKQLGLPADDVIEMSECKEVGVFQCIALALHNFKVAKEVYNDEIIPDMVMIRFHMRFDKAKRESDYWGILFAFMIAVQDYGVSPGLGYFLMTFPESIWKLISRKARGID